MVAVVSLVGGRADAQWSAQTLGGMNVELYTPDADSPVGSGRALMVVLHGCTQSAAALRTEGNLAPAADALGVVMAVPDVPDGGVIAGCWDYYGSMHTRTSSHIGPVLDMVEQLLADNTLSIDPDQVYVVGFSSGGGEALVLGCVAPDVFAGVGAVAAPALGTESTEISTVSTTPAQAAELCASLAEDQAAALGTQAAFTFADASDFTVTPEYNAVNAGMFGLVYARGLDSLDTEALDLAELPGASPAGSGMTFADQGGVRIAQLDSSAGEGHAWPSGSGAPNNPATFITGTGLNLSRFAAEFFAVNNPRAGGWEPPGGTGGSSGSGGADESGGEPPGTTTGGTDGPGQTAGTTAGSASTDPSSAGEDGTGGDPNASSTSTASESGEAQDSGPSGCSVWRGSPPASVLFGMLLFGLRRRRASVLPV